MNITNRDIMNCFPLLASVLGNKYGVEIRIGGEDAKTDGNIIYLPSMPPNLDAETLENAKGYVDHESAHIRSTNFELVQKSSMDNVTKWLFNAIEDWRVENRLSEIFPGCRENFRRLIRRIFVDTAKEGAGNANPALSILGYVLFTVRSWDVPEINPRLQERRRIVDSLAKGLPDKLDKILEAVRSNCPDTQTAIDYAFKLAKCIRHCSCNDTSIGNDVGNAGNQNNSHESRVESSSGNSKNTKPDFGNDNVENNSNGHENKNEGGEGDSCSNFFVNSSVSNSRNDEQENSSSYADACAGSAKAHQINQQIEDLFSAPMDQLPQNLGEILAGELEAGKEENKDKGVIVATIGERIAPLLPAEEIVNALRCCNAMRHRLCGLLQALALKQSGIGRKGKLHTGSLHRISTGNPKVFRQESPQTGVNTAVHILLDCSSSMSGSAITIARDASYAVAKTLESIPDVNLAVTVFPAYLQNDSVCTIIEPGQRVGKNFGFSASGDTPLGPALWWVIQQMVKLKEDRKIILVITDGMPNEIKPAKVAIAQCLKLGLEVYGIGIQCECVKYFLPKSSVIQHLDELAPAMFEILKSAMLKGVGK